MRQWHWHRLLGIAAIAGLFIYSVVFLRLRVGRGETTPGMVEDHSQKLPYRPQDEHGVIEPITSEEGARRLLGIFGTGGDKDVAQGSLVAVPSTATKPSSAAGTLSDAQATSLLHGEAVAKSTTASPASSEEPTRTSTTSTPTSTSTEISKIIVMGKTQSEDTNWVGEELPDWQHAIYAVDLMENETSATGLKTRTNKAKEAMPYLTYLADNYPDFPDVVVFLHAHRRGYPVAWHNDAQDHDAAIMMKQLHLQTIRDRGYVNLRCQPIPGCPNEIQPWRYPPDPERVPEQLFPYVYAEFFNRTLHETQAEIQLVAVPCCAQFAVSREQILTRPKEEYERYRKYLEETKYSDDHIGRVMEYMWHIMFGQDPISCPADIASCECEVYGRCMVPAAGGRYRLRPPG